MATKKKQKPAPPRASAKVTELEIADVKRRVKAQIARHGGGNPVLDRVRSMFGKFAAQPTPDALVLLKGELKVVEKMAPAEKTAPAGA